MKRVILLLSLSIILCFSNQVFASSKINEGTALLVIDVQKAFSDPEGFSPVCREQADKMLPIINGVVEHFSSLGNQVIYIKQDYVRDTELDSRLKLVGDLQFTKKDPSAFSNSEFTAHLQTEKIDTLFIVGLAAEYCVSATVTDALKKGFSVTVIADGISAKMCSSLSDEIESFKEKGAQIVFSKDFL